MSMRPQFNNFIGSFIDLAFINEQWKQRNACTDAHLLTTIVTLLYIDFYLYAYTENEMDWFSKRLEPYTHPKIDLAQVAKAGLC